jgi:hypothetical protein
MLITSAWEYVFACLGESYKTQLKHILCGKYRRFLMFNQVLHASQHSVAKG